MVTEDYVSFETAKLLKEKGFDGNSFYVYTLSEEGEHCLERLYDDDFFEEEIMIYAPTLQMAMKWLREVHRIETHIALSELNADNSRKYMFDIFSSDMNRDFDSIQEYGFNSYEETCEAAIKYCLENLI